MKFERQEHALHIPNFKIIKKLRGQEVITVKEVNSNLDVYYLFNQDLAE